MKLMMLDKRDRLTVNRISSTSPSEAKDADLSHLKRVVVEIHNYCNRKCSFCLNATIDRRSEKVLMDLTTFQSILEQLAADNFGGALMFGRYHEPLSDQIITGYVRLAKEILPLNRISMNTNGDYFSVGFVRTLLVDGLSDMNVMLYLPQGIKYSDDAIASAARRFAEKHRLQLKPIRVVADQLQVFKVVSPDDLQGKIFLHGENYGTPGLGCDRGGVLGSLVDNSVRETSCAAPFFELNIDHDGDVMPCCNLLSDVPSHRKYKIGVIADETLKAIYFSEHSVKFRSLVSAKETLPPVCRTCQYYWPNRPNYEA